MSCNKSVRQELEKKYGKGCTFEKADIEEQIDELNKTKKRKIKKYKKYKEERHYTSKKIQQLEELISVHHLVHRSERRRN